MIDIAGRTQFKYSDPVVKNLSVSEIDELNRLLSSPIRPLVFEFGKRIGDLFLREQQRVRESNPLSAFRGFAQSRYKHALGCALKGKMQIRRFARIAQNYAVPVSEFVRKTIGRFYGLLF